MIVVENSFNGEFNVGRELEVGVIFHNDRNTIVNYTLPMDETMMEAAKDIAAAGDDYVSIFLFHLMNLDQSNNGLLYRAFQEKAEKCDLFISKQTYNIFKARGEQEDVIFIHFVDTTTQKTIISFSFEKKNE